MGVVIVKGEGAVMGVDVNSEDAMDRNRRRKQIRDD